MDKVSRARFFRVLPKVLIIEDNHDTNYLHLNQALRVVDEACVLHLIKAIALLHPLLVKVFLSYASNHVFLNPILSIDCLNEGLFFLMLDFFINVFKVDLIESNF